MYMFIHKYMCIHEHLHTHVSALFEIVHFKSNVVSSIASRVKYSDKIATRYLTCKDTTFDMTETHSCVGHFSSKDTMGWLR